MDKNKENVPKRRFPGFIDSWEQRKLSELLISSDKRNKVGKYTQDNILAASLGTELVKKHIFFGLRSTEESVKNYRVVNSGDVIYTKSPIKGYPNGIIRTNKGLEGIVPSLYCVYHSISSINSSFIQSYFEDKGRLDAYLYPMVNIGARNNVNITDLGFLEGTIRIPQNIDEQNKIVDFFNHLTNLISLHQCKLEHLKDKKKGLLQKMFPKEGEKFPEVRFPGFTDPWEQRKLSDIYKTIGNAFVGTSTPYYVTDGHFYLESNNVKDGQINRNAEIFINEEFYQKQKDKWLRTGDMVMVQSGHVGHAAVIPEKLDNTAAHALIMFKNPKEKIEPYFLNYQYQTLKSKKKIENITVGNTIKHILASDMQDFEVDIPKFEEQTKIATFFREIDNLINLNQIKLEHLQQQKKGLLQQMFI